MSQRSTSAYRALRRAQQTRNGAVDGRPVRRDNPTLRDRIETAVKSGPVKTWADMTEDERAEVRRSLGQDTVKP